MIDLRLGSQLSLCFLTMARYEESAALHTEEIKLDGDHIIVSFPKGKQYHYGECRLAVIAGNPLLPINPVAVIIGYVELLKEVK